MTPVIVTCNKKFIIPASEKLLYVFFVQINTMLTVFEHFVQDGKIDKVKLRHNMNNILHVDYGYAASITCPISYE